MFIKKNSALCVASAFSSETPHVVDTQSLNVAPLCEGYPVVYDAVHEKRTVLHGADMPERVHVGFESVRLRWMKPDGKGGLVPKYN